MPVGKERHMPNPATVREQRLRKTKARLIDEIDTLEQRTAAKRGVIRDVQARADALVEE